jgi:hypothetical protein
MLRTNRVVPPPTQPFAGRIWTRPATRPSDAKLPPIGLSADGRQGLVRLT